MLSDIQLTQTDQGYYDFEIANGDFVMTNGLDTALIISLFADARADNSEVPVPILRRGWWGDLVSDYPTYQTGSKLWLLNQARSNLETLNLSKTYMQNSLSWLTDDKLASKINVDAAFTTNGIGLQVTIYTPQNQVNNYAYNLWQNTI